MVKVYEHTWDTLPTSPHICSAISRFYVGVPDSVELCDPAMHERIPVNPAVDMANLVPGESYGRD